MEKPESQEIWLLPHSCNTKCDPRCKDFQSRRHLSICHVGADILTRGHLWSCTFVTIIRLGRWKRVWDWCPRWAAHLPWVEGSPPCSCPGTSYPSSSHQSRCPCRTWRWIFLTIWLFCYFVICLFLDSPVLSLPVAVHGAHSVATVPLVHLWSHCYSSNATCVSRLLLALNHCILNNIGHIWCILIPKGKLERRQIVQQRAKAMKEEEEECLKPGWYSSCRTSTPPSPYQRRNGSRWRCTPEQHGVRCKM